MAPHSSTLAWKIPWTEKPGRLQTMGSQLHFHFSLSCIGEGNGNPLQCSCLENPRDGGAWWAAVYGVAQSRIQLKRLSSSILGFVTLSCLGKSREATVPLLGDFAPRDGSTVFHTLTSLSYSDQRNDVIMLTWTAKRRKGR